MIHIELPKYDVVIYKSDQLGEVGKPQISSWYGFIDYVKIPRRVAGIYLFFNEKDELLYCGKTDSLRSRIRTHFYDNVSAIKDNRDEVYKIACCFVPDPYEREIYETHAIHQMKSKYNIDKVFFDRIIQI